MVKPKREIPQRPSRLDKGEKDKRRRFAKKKQIEKKSRKERKRAKNRERKQKIKKEKTKKIPKRKKKRKREPGARQTDEIWKGKNLAASRPLRVIGERLKGKPRGNGPTAP